MGGLGDRVGDALVAAGNGGLKANAIIRLLAVVVVGLSGLVLLDMRDRSKEVLKQVEWTAGVAAQINNSVAMMGRDVQSNTKAIDYNRGVNEKQNDDIKALGRDLGRIEGKR